MNGAATVLIVFLSGLGPTLLGYAQLRPVPPVLVVIATAWFLGAGSIALTFYVISSTTGGLMAQPAVALSLGLSVACGVVWWRIRKPTNVSESGALAPKWHIVLGSIAVLLTVLNLALVTAYAVMTPFLAWDSWAHWALIARHWVGMDALLPLQNLSEWLTSSPSQGRFITSANSPIFLPLLIAWLADLSGSWNERELSVIWPATFAAIILGTAGWLRWHKIAWPGCAVGAFIASGVPMVAVHASLAGYADLWLGGAFLMACITGAMAVGTRQLLPVSPVLGALALLITLTKPAGALWAAIVLAATVAALLSWKQLVGLAVAGLALMVVAGQAGLSVYGIELTPSAFNDISGPLFRVLFVYPDWQLVMPALLLAGLASIRVGWRTDDRVMLMATLAGLFFTVAALSLTHYGAEAGLMALINRTLMPAMLTAVAFSWPVLCRILLTDRNASAE